MQDEKIEVTSGVHRSTPIGMLLLMLASSEKPSVEWMSHRNHNHPVSAILRSRASELTPRDRGIAGARRTSGNRFQMLA